MSQSVNGTLAAYFCLVHECLTLICCGPTPSIANAEWILSWFLIWLLNLMLCGSHRKQANCPHIVVSGVILKVLIKQKYLEVTLYTFVNWSRIKCLQENGITSCDCECMLGVQNDNYYINIAIFSATIQCMQYHWLYQYITYCDTYIAHISNVHCIRQVFLISYAAFTTCDANF